jgi:glycosyltransferase involved in cell wall biosynthesis
MRVAVVVRTLKIGGMEKVAVSLADAFAQSGHESHLIYFKDRDNVFEPDPKVTLHHFNLDLLMQMTVIGLVWELVARIFNIVLRKSYFIWKGLFTSLLFKLKLQSVEKKTGKFDLIIIRGQGTFEMLWPLKDRRIVQVCENVVYSDAKRRTLNAFYMSLIYNQKNIACVSHIVEKSYSEMQKKYRLSNPSVMTVTNPIDPAETKRLSDAYIPEMDQPYIVSVGRIVPIKNIPLLIDAYVYAVKTFGLKHKLVIVGDGSDKTKVRAKIAQLKLEENVVLTGFLSNPYPWMKEADLFVLSSKSEGLGMVLLEAIACGTKVVSTDCDGVRDVMKGELARNLAKQEAKDLAEKIVSALDDNSIDYAKYLKDFMPQTIVEKFIETYAEKR